MSLVIGGTVLSGSFIIYAFMGWAFLTLNEESRLRLFNAFLAILTPLLFLSIIEYLIFIVSGEGIILATVERRFDTTSGNSQVFLQLLFNFIAVGSDLPRFQAFFEEPGAVGNISILVLFLTGDGKHRLAHIITWIAGIISFSLGFYFLAAIYLLGRKIKLSYLIVFAVSVFFG